MATQFTFNGAPATEAQYHAGICKEQIETCTISKLAQMIRKDWKDKVNYAAKPYLNAMLEIGYINDNYGCESARDVVIYFLSNASSWRGETARLVKAELKRRCGIK